MKKKNAHTHTHTALPGCGWTFSTSQFHFASHICMFMWPLRVRFDPKCSNRTKVIALLQSRQAFPRGRAAAGDLSVVAAGKWSRLVVVGNRTGHMETCWGDGTASKALSALLYTHTHTLTDMTSLTARVSYLSHLRLNEEKCMNCLLVLFSLGGSSCIDFYMLHLSPSLSLSLYDLHPRFL